MSRTAQRWLLGLLVLGCALVVRQSRLHAARHYLQTQTYEDIYYLPPPWALELISLGHRQATADLIWLRALIYYGDELTHRGGVRHVYSYGEAMLSLDPDFKKVYHWVATTALYRPGSITARDSERAIEYLERGVRRFPDDCELAWDLGAHYTYELPPLLDDNAKKEAARERGLPHLEVASRLGCAPAWLALGNASRLLKQGQREQAIRQLLEVYSTVSDPYVRGEIELRVARLQGEANAEAFRRTWAEFEANRKRDFPYVDAGLYLLLGPRPPVDGTALRLSGFDPLSRATDRLGEEAAP
jgi:tetratricopeptide (TPR) repeat protein